MTAIDTRIPIEEALQRALTDAKTSDPVPVPEHLIRRRLSQAGHTLTDKQFDALMQSQLGAGKIERHDNRAVDPRWQRVITEPQSTAEREAVRYPKPNFGPPRRERRMATPQTDGTGALKDDQLPRDLPLWFIKYRQQIESELAAERRKVSELETAIMQHKTEQTRALSIYGSPNALQELTEQVALSPKFVDLTPQEHKYVASVGLASGLNPEFHLHAWKQTKRVKDEKGNWKTVKLLSILPDYKGLMASVDDPIMTDERRLTKDEMKARGIPEAAINEGAIAYEFTVTRLKQAIMAKQAGITYTPVRGYGWWEAMKDEEKWDKGQNKYVATGKRIPNDTPNARDGEWVAKKRAIRDAFNQVADLRLKFIQVEGAEVVEDEWQFTGDPEAIEGDFVVNEDLKINATIASTNTNTSSIIDTVTGEVIQNTTSDAPQADSSDVEENDDEPQAQSDDAPKCANCSEPATGDGPYPNLCKKHANDAANFHAAKNS